LFPVLNIQKDEPGSNPCFCEGKIACKGIGKKQLETKKPFNFTARPYCAPEKICRVQQIRIPVTR
jgi:hypothetical protein